MPSHAANTEEHTTPARPTPPQQCTYTAWPFFFAWWRYSMTRCTIAWRSATLMGWQSGVGKWEQRTWDGRCKDTTPDIDSLLSPAPFMVGAWRVSVGEDGPSSSLCAVEGDDPTHSLRCASGIPMSGMEVLLPVEPFSIRTLPLPLPPLEEEESCSRSLCSRNTLSHNRLTLSLYFPRRCNSLVSFFSTKLTKKRTFPS